MTTAPDPFAGAFTQDRLLDLILLGFSGIDEPTPAQVEATVDQFMVGTHGNRHVKRTHIGA